MKILIEAWNVGDDKMQIVISGIKFRKQIPVFFNWDYSHVECLAEVSVIGDKLFASIESLPRYAFMYFPAIAYKVIKHTHILKHKTIVINESDLCYISLNTLPNADHSIKSIREQLKQQ